jgi:hypothetical protein
MRFRLESEMLNSLMDCLPTVFLLRTGERAKVLVEPTIGSVIPDLIFATWSGELPRCDTLNSVSRHVLAWLTSQKIALGEVQLCEELFLSQQAAAAAVSSLKRIGAVAQRESGEVELCPQFDPSGVVTLIALEVKMKRWKEALEQATAYRTFADQAYVVLDGNQVKLTPAIEAAFVSKGIGLFLQYGTKLEQKIVAAPNQKPAPSFERLLAVCKVSSSRPYCVA